MPEQYIALALTKDQCHAVMSACTAAAIDIERNANAYDHILAETGKSALDLMGLYANVILYIEDKLGL